MQTINIKINKAKLEGFSVEFGEDKPEITATISLLTEQGKSITSYSISSKTWMSNHFDIPIEVIGPILAIASRLEKVVTDHCQSTALQLEAPAY